MGIDTAAGYDVGPEMKRRQSKGREYAPLKIHGMVQNNKEVGQTVGWSCGQKASRSVGWSGGRPVGWSEGQSVSM